MQNKSTYKKDLIAMVNEIDFSTKANDEKEDYLNDKRNKKKDKKNEIGSTNIRSVASVCQNADCFEEVKLYIEYKIGKGNGWEQKITVKKDGKDIKKVFGTAVIEHLEQIYKDSKEYIEKKQAEEKGIKETVDSESLKRMSLYFGYLFWKKVSVEKGNF